MAIILEFIFSWLLVLLVVSMPIAWVWVLYYKIKCRKVSSFADRKCKYWDLCNHNHTERKKDEMELRKQNLLRRYD